MSKLVLGSLFLLCLFGCDGGGRPEVALAARGPAAESLPGGGSAICRMTAAGRPLPAEVRETSGLTQSRRDPNLFWTHNDSGNRPDLFAVDAEGKLVGRVRVQGTKLQDWEDLEGGPCAAGVCLFAADIGDNDQKRESITIYEIPEPSAGASEAAPVQALHARFPDGPQDAEALFRLPSGDLFVVTKGRHGPIALYRYPAPHRLDEVVTLERVRELWPQPGNADDRVTAATASPDGRWVGIRTYRALHLYSAPALVGAEAAEPVTIDLRPLREIQGEALVIADDGTVWLTSEAEQRRDQPRLSRLECTLPTDG